MTDDQDVQDDEEEIDGCNLEITEDEATPDEDLGRDDASFAPLQSAAEAATQDDADVMQADAPAPPEPEGDA